MTSYNFDLLDLADGESGDTAVSVVVGKKKAAAAKLAAAAKPTATQEKTKCFSYYTKLKHDSGVRICQQDLKSLRDSLGKLRKLKTELRELEGYESRLMQLWDERSKLRQEQRKLREKEETLVQQRNAFYNEHGIPLPEEEEKPNNKSHGANADPSSYYNCVSDNDGGSSGYSDYCGYNGVSDSDGGSSGYSDYSGNNDQYQTLLCDYPHGHDERQTGRGHDRYNNGDRHLGEIEPPEVDGHIADHSVADGAGIQDWVHIDISGPNSVADTGAQDWVYIDISGPNSHTNGA